MTNTNNNFCSLIALNNIEINLKLKHTLEGVFKTLICFGFENFLLCENNTFDSLCYNTLQNLKNIYPQIKRIKCTNNTKRIYEDTLLLNQLDTNNKKEFYLNLIDKSNFIVFYSNKKNKNFDFLINYCEQNKKTYLVL